MIGRRRHATSELRQLDEWSFGSADRLSQHPSDALAEEAATESACQATHRACRHPFGDKCQIVLGWQSGKENSALGFLNSAVSSPRSSSSQRIFTQTDCTQTDCTQTGASHRGQPFLYEGDSHLLTVAPTGAGKGRGVIIPNLLTYQGPLVVFDPKGENYLTTARRRREMGQRVIKLDPFGVVDQQSDGLNPMDVFQLQGADLESDAQMLAELLSTSNRGLKEPFWDLTGCGLHTGVIAHVAHDRRNEPAEVNLNTVCRLLTSDDVAYSLAAVVEVFGKTMNEMSHREISSFLQLPEATRGGVQATAGSYIKAFLSQRVANTLEKSTFELSEFVDGGPLSIYMILPPDKLASHAALLRLWVGTLLKAITSRRQIPRQRTLFLLDECGQLGNFPFLERVITLCRGYGVQCWTFWQDLSQLQKCYPSSWETLLNNCGVLQTFGLNTRSTANKWADHLDHSPNQLRALRADEQVVLVGDLGEFQLRRLDYLRDRCFDGLYDQNRFFALCRGLSSSSGWSRLGHCKPL